MSILDRYIIKTFLINFAVLLTVIMSLFVLVDVITDIDEFLKAGPRRAQAPVIREVSQQFSLDRDRLQAAVRRDITEQQLIDSFGLTPQQAAETWPRFQVSTLAHIGWTVFVLADYYIPTILLIYVYFSGLLVAGAMGFTLASLSRTRELTAMVAGGLSLYRVAAPIIVAGMALTLLPLPLQEYVLPPLADKLLRSKSEVAEPRIRSQAVLFTPDGKGNLITAARFEFSTDDQPSTLRGVRILERDPETLTLKRRIAGDHADWDPAAQAWTFIGSAYAAEPEDARALRDRMQGPEPVDAFPTQLSPDVLLARQASQYIRLLDLRRLRELQQNPAVQSEPRLVADIIRTIWSRFSLLILNLLVLVIGLPFFLAVAPANPLTQALKAAGLCLSTWGLGLIALQAGADTMPPVLTAWLPVILAIPLAAYLLTLVKT
ncbi:MAG: LptF/LptG family permease [Planctomycetota bacterium]